MCIRDRVLILRQQVGVAGYDRQRGFQVMGPVSYTHLKTEMLSRYEVEMEHYSKIINIEARTMLKICLLYTSRCV